MNKKINEEFQVLVEKATSGDKNADCKGAG